MVSSHLLFALVFDVTCFVYFPEFINVKFTVTIRGINLLEPGVFYGDTLRQRVNGCFKVGDLELQI